MSAVIEYIQKYRRFFAAGLVGCLMVVMLGTGIDAMAVEKDPVQNVYQSFIRIHVKPSLQIFTLFYKKT